MAYKEIKTAITIAAKPALIWEVFINFSAYKNWNPFLTSIEGIPKVGSKLKITAGGMNFSPKVLVCKTDKEFSWLGKFLFKGLFDGEHKFEIIDNGNGTSTFKQEEKFRKLKFESFLDFGYII